MKTYINVNKIQVIKCVYRYTKKCSTVTLVHLKDSYKWPKWLGKYEQNIYSDLGYGRMTEDELIKSYNDNIEILDNNEAYYRPHIIIKMDNQKEIVKFFDDDIDLNRYYNGHFSKFNNLLEL